MSEWISVKDGMPKEKQRAHIIGKRSDFVIVYVIVNDSGEEIIGGDATFNGEWINFPADEYTVTHWMKYPKPPTAIAKQKSADEMFVELEYHPTMKCQTRRTYQKVVDHRQFDIVVDARRVWKSNQNIICPADNSVATWWKPEELLAAAKALQEMGEENE